MPIPSQAPVGRSFAGRGRPALRAAVLATGSALAILPVQAQTSPPWRAAVAVEQSHLDRGSGTWYSEQVRIGRHWSARQLLELEASHTRRYGLDDMELAASGAWPIGDALTATARIATSATHRVLPRDSVTAGLQWELRPAWLIHGGVRHTRYNTDDVAQATFGVEHYFGDFGATLLAHRARGLDRTLSSGEVRLAWYPKQGHSATLFASAGDEATALGGGGVALARVRSLALTGRHAVGSGWSLEWGLHRVQQGDFHRRHGAALGVQRAF